MDKVCTIGLTEKYTRVSGNAASSKVMEFGKVKMATSTWVNGIMDYLKVKVYINAKMATVMKASGKMRLNMVKELIFFLMEMFLLASM